MKITKMSKLAGISIRTLHYYDEIGLLSPSRNTENNRREYTGNDFLKLHQIIYYKKMGLPLQRVKEIMNDPNYNIKAVFKEQIDYLENEKAKIENQIETMSKFMSVLDADDNSISENQYLALFSGAEDNYDIVTEEFWGAEITETSKQIILSMPSELQQDIADAMQQYLVELSCLTDLEPSSSTVQRKIHEYHIFLNQTHGNLYTTENFLRLGAFYTNSEVFRNSLESIKEGLSDFVSNAIKEYVQSLNKK